MVKKTLAIDFDGVLYDYRGQWDEGKILRGPVEGALGFVREVLKQGIEVVVLTCRALSPEGLQGVRDWLQRQGFPELEVTAIKPPAVWYLDDRGWRFTGNFATVLSMLPSLERPWWTERPSEG